jgi:hypothetical protein
MHFVQELKLTLRLTGSDFLFIYCLPKHQHRLVCIDKFHHDSDTGFLCTALEQQGTSQKFETHLHCMRGDEQKILILKHRKAKRCETGIVSVPCSRSCVKSNAGCWIPDYFLLSCAAQTDFTWLCVVFANSDIFALIHSIASCMWRKWTVPIAW